MQTYEALQKKMSELWDIRAAISLMMWDQEVMMPSGGHGFRAKQTATLNGLLHEKFIAEAGPIIEDCASKINELAPEGQRNVQMLVRELSERQKVPADFIREMSRVAGESFSNWRKAKIESDFSIFQDSLSTIVDMKRQEAEYLGYEENPYDALMRTYEWSAKASEISTLFEGFKGSLGELLDEIKAQPQIDNSFLKAEISQEKQMAFGHHLLESIGYDFNHGRQDLAAHPFMIAMNPQDVRVTTSVIPNDLEMMMYSTLHEGGHALYERGIPAAAYGMPGADSCSLSIHESQSRLWENNVSRGLPFLSYHFPELRKLFPNQLQGKSEMDVFRAFNRVEPSLIRIAADELTYHFHIILRFELENDLVNRRLEVADLPAAWNEKVKKYLGLEVPNDAQGALQDIHWSHGNIGYFPTYSLGSFYAAQFYHAASEHIGNLEAEFRKGNFIILKDWLNENIHQWGKQFDAKELCERVTGEPLNVDYFVKYARKKFGLVYNLKN